MNHLPPSGASQQPGQDLWQQPGAQAAGNTAWEREVLERLVLATVNEQRAARRWRIFWRLLWMGLFGAAIWFFGKEGATTTVSGPHTAVVEIKGEIASGADASAEFVNAAMRSALEDSGSKALVLLINSPGGSPVQAGMINDEILRLKALHQKPVYAVVEETCASAAYYIAAAADEIYVDKASLVGAAAYARSIRVSGIGRGSKPREETLEIRSLNNAAGVRGRKGKEAGWTFRLQRIEKVQ